MEERRGNHLHCAQCAINPELNSCYLAISKSLYTLLAAGCRTYIMSASSLITLPAELQEQIIQELAFPDNIFLGMTCRYFYTILKPPTHEQLLSAENTEFTIREDIYACRDCLRLRRASRFADNMTKKKRRRSGLESYNRFCVECGLKSGPGNTRYTRGSRIMIKGVCHVICIRCGQFKEGSDDNNGLSECETCGARKRAFNEELKRREEQFQKARLRAERIAERERRRKFWGSDNGSSAWNEEQLDDSSAWNEEQLAMVQAEADCYMNSPGPGSD